MKVLCIDGGGIRGLIPALVLAEIEERTGRPVADLFDYVAGTSTGGIIACGLTMSGDDGRPAYTARDLVGLYETEGPRIFHRDLLKRIVSVEGLVDERYEDDGLNDALRRYFGGARLRDALAPILVTAYDISGRFAFLFRSERAVVDPTYDFPLADVARATSAAPTYFEPFEVTDAAGDRTYPLIDGGIYAVNPSMCAIAELAATGRRDEIGLLASLGTGSHTRPYEHRVARDWGQLEWARPLIDMVFDGVADTIDFEAAALLAPGAYARLQVDLLEGADDLDDASERNLGRLRLDAERLLRERAADIDALCEALVA